MKKKLLFCAFNLEVGGVEKCLVNLVNTLDKDKYDLTILLQVKEGKLLNNVDKNIHIVDYNLSKNKNFIIKKISNIFKFLKIIIKNHHKYDFSACYATGYVPSAIVALFASKNNAIWMHTNISTYMDNYKPYENKKWSNTKKCKKFINRLFFRLYKKHFFVSNNGMNIYLNIYPNDKNKCIMCHNIIDYESILNFSKEKITSDLNLKNEKVLLNVSRHTEYDKRLSRIIKAAIKLKKENYKFKIIFVGDGAEHKDYVKLVKDNKLDDYIIFVGEKANPFPYYKLADAFILSSAFEGFPTTFLEALVLNIPIITTDVSDARDDIDNKYGIVVPNNDESIYDGIKEYLDNGFVIKEKFDPKKFNQDSIDKLESVINNG